jgi:hypothetical protein
MQSFFGNSFLGFPPTGTPSCSCAGCGKDGGPLQTLSQCPDCQSFTCLYCSSNCRTSDATRHKEECTWTQQLKGRTDERIEKKKAIKFMENITEWGSDDPDGPLGKLLQNMRGGRKNCEEETKILKEEAVRDRERDCAEHLFIRKSQLERATEMYRTRNRLPEIPLPPHTHCQNLSCSKRFSPPPMSETKRCSRCNMVRYCSIQCQKKDWKNHKVWCRVPAAESK